MAKKKSLASAATNQPVKKFKKGGTTTNQKAQIKGKIIRQRNSQGVLLDEAGLELPDGAATTIDGFKGQNYTGLNRRTPEKRRLINSRIEEIRGLMSLNMTRKDVIEVLKTKWKLGKESIIKYWELARKRQMAYLEKTAPEAKSDSLHYWTRRLIESATAKQKATTDLEKARELVNEANIMMRRANEKKDTSDETFDNISKVLNTVRELRDGARRAVTYWSSEADGVQDRIDKLTGNYSPEKIAFTDIEGQTLARREPLTREEAAEQLRKVLADLATYADPKSLPKGFDPTKITLEAEAIPIKVVEETAPQTDEAFSEVFERHETNGHANGNGNGHTNGHSH